MASPVQQLLAEAGQACSWPVVGAASWVEGEVAFDPDGQTGTVLLSSHRGVPDATLECVRAALEGSEWPSWVGGGQTAARFTYRWVK